MMNFKLYFCIVTIVALSGANLNDVGYKVTTVSSYKNLKTSGKSALYEIQTTDAAYDWPVYLVDLHGSRYQMGYDYGYMLGEFAQQAYDNLFKSLLSGLGVNWSYDIVKFALEQALDWQWDSYLSQQLPSAYKEELAGIAAGGKAAGFSALDRKASRTITLANMPGDVQDAILILIREWENAFSKRSILSDLVKTEKISGLQCSMFAVWGNRTTDGSLLSARNLDWNKDTGIQKYKLVTVYQPDDGSYSHAVLGYAGLPGALTGISMKGLTVHEANLEENEIAFSGFPWLLRLRYIMEKAKNIAEAQLLWEQTNNTVGFNHMVASAVDRTAIAMETMYGYTAYFKDNDVREQKATYTYPDTGKTVQIGFPLKQALYRTNHGYDPTIRQHYEWNQSPESWSMQRYMFAYNGFSWYEQSGVKIDELAAVNMTAILGDKGRHAYQCTDNTDGSNVLSVTFHPSSNIMYSAWEDGTGSSWRPACCNYYIKIDLSYWWNKN